MRRGPWHWVRSASTHPLFVASADTGGGNRTHTGLPPEDFKSSASAIPPRRQGSLSSKAVDRQSKSRQLDVILASKRHPSKTRCPNVRGSWRGFSRKQTEGVGFEPTVGFHLLRFSRPSRSTTLAPLLLPSNVPDEDTYTGRTCCLALPSSPPPRTSACLRAAAHLVQNIVGDEDRNIHRHRQRDRITRP
jgi:hypothetical protein